MNKFAHILEVERFKKVTYYTIQFENDNGEQEEETEFEKFISCHQNNPTIEDEFADIIAWIKIIGDDIGANTTYFRHERRANALPPPTKFIEIDYLEHLRLYCMLISNSVVILFNGGIKTAAKAQDCPTVGPHFRLANQLAKAIDELIVDKLIWVDDKTQRLVIEDGIEIIL